MGHTLKQCCDERLAIEELRENIFALSCLTPPSTHSSLRLLSGRPVHVHESKWRKQLKVETLTGFTVPSRTSLFQARRA